MEDGDQRQASYVRHGLGLLCIGAIGLLIGFAGRGDDGERPWGEGPALGEQIAQTVGGLGGLVAIIALIYIAIGLLRG